ncbi:MAG: hypothetical protein JST87_03935 [Bacteroidetes bacterium]|nr:hypothetical protein [Bacteroidota bacterium]
MMNKFWILIYMVPILSFSQNQSRSKFEKIIFDANLTNPFFDIPKIVKENVGGTTIIERGNTGSKDTINKVNRERDIIINAKISDTGRKHIGFDNGIAYSWKDTLVLQFQNNKSNEPSFNYWDKLIIYIINDQFYAEYIWTTKSVYQLIETRQKLILEKPVSLSNRQIRGELLIDFSNKNVKSFAKKITFAGPFDLVLQ